MTGRCGRRWRRPGPRSPRPAGGDGGDLHDLEASALGQGELASLTSPSLFGGGPVVIVRNAQNAGKEIAAELDEVRHEPGA